MGHVVYMRALEYVVGYEVNGAYKVYLKGKGGELGGGRRGGKLLATTV